MSELDATSDIIVKSQQQIRLSFTRIDLAVYAYTFLGRLSWVGLGVGGGGGSFIPEYKIWKSVKYIYHFRNQIEEYICGQAASFGGSLTSGVDHDSERGVITERLSEPYGKLFGRNVSIT